MSKKKTDKKNYNIKCDVTSCEHNNSKEGACNLKNISVSCNCCGDQCHDSYETICQSFKETGANITDNEYEVNSQTECD